MQTSSMILARPPIILSVLIGTGLLSAENPLSETRSALEKWVETRQLISKTRSDWVADRELLEQNIDLYERELAALESQLGKVSTNGVQVEKERNQAEVQLKAATNALAAASQFAATFETDLVSLAQKLPDPLRETLRPHLDKIPTNSVSTRTLPTDRIQVIVTALNEVDKFNGSISVFPEKQRNPKGEEVAVRTIYAGIGAAYFVNDLGDFSGLGLARTNGWEWIAKPELAPLVKEAIQIYRNERPAQFISLPLVIQ